MTITAPPVTSELPRQRAASTLEPMPALSAPDAAELLARLIACDEQAWRVAVLQYHRLVVSAVRKVLNEPADIEEATQRTWLAFWMHADSVKDPSRLPGWLSVTARREALSLIRSRRREVLTDDLSGYESGWVPDTYVQVEMAERARYLHQAVERLPERQRRLMTELLADRASYEELSRTLNIPRGSIGPMRARALRALRGMLAEFELEAV